MLSFFLLKTPIVYIWYKGSQMIFVMYPATLLWLITRIFLPILWNFFIDGRIICEQSFISSLPMRMPFISFSRLTAVGRTSVMMLNRSDERRCLVLFTVLGGKLLVSHRETIGVFYRWSLLG